MRVYLEGGSYHISIFFILEVKIYFRSLTGT